MRLNLATADAVRQAYAELTQLAAGLPGDIEGVVIQAMVKGGAEVLIGVAQDRLFGPLVGFGTGGVDVEVWRDVQFRIAPLTDRDADEMIREIRGFPLLQGHRGRPAVDLPALRDILLRISRLAADVHEIAELDLNPVIALASGEGYRVVDGRVRIATPTA